MTLFGPDISHYQAGFNYQRAVAEGCSFVIGKIGQGSGGRDAQWPKTRDQARAAGLLVAGYWYVDTSNAAAQAANCAGWIGDKSIPVALDWEAGGGNFANLKAVTAAFRRAGLNVRLVYTGQWYHQQQGSPDLRPLGLALWKSRYPSTTPASPASVYSHVPANYWAGLGGLDTKILQFTDHAAIAGITCDCSAFNGTRDELAALFGQEEDDMTDEDRTMLKDIHDALPVLLLIWEQLAGGGADPFSPDPAKIFPGWGPLAAKLPLEAQKTLVDWVRNEALDAPQA